MYSVYHRNGFHIVNGVMGVEYMRKIIITGSEKPGLFKKSNPLGVCVFIGFLALLGFWIFF